MAIPSVVPGECMYIGSIRYGSHLYEGGCDRMIDEANKAIKRSYAPYSGFQVRGHPPSPWAAIAMAVSEGVKGFEALGVVADAEGPVAPCRICRQNLIEFEDEIKVIMENSRRNVEIATAGELLPRRSKRDNII